jgi:hypothetical protein
MTLESVAPTVGATAKLTASYQWIKLALSPNAVIARGRCIFIISVGTPPSAEHGQHRLTLYLRG